MCIRDRSKNIPIAAGLGGGSSDAAMTLIGLNKFWGLDLNLDQLFPIASALGSDIPFFLNNGTAMVQGKGELIRALPPANIKHAVILSPDISIKNKTAHMFSTVRSQDYTKGALTRKLEARIRRHGDIPSELLFNVFDEISIRIFPELNLIRQMFSDIWSGEVHLCGAGPSLFTLVESRENATALSLLLNRKTGFNAYVVEPTKVLYNHSLSVVFVYKFPVSPCIGPNSALNLFFLFLVNPQLLLIQSQVYLIYLWLS